MVRSLEFVGKSLGLSVVATLLAAGTALAKPCPNIMLIVDKSASMAQDPAGHEPTDPKFVGPSKFELLQKVLINLVQQYGDHVPFGLEFSGAGNIVPAQPNDTACMAEAVIDIPLSHSAASDIIAAIKTATPDGSNTNTGECVSVAAAQPAMHDASKPNIIILVTDGTPNCTAEDSRAVIAGDISNSVAGRLISAAYSQKPKVLTYVVGFDASADAGTDSYKQFQLALDAMAFAGGMEAEVKGCMGSGLGSPCYYQAGAKEADFQAVIDGIVLGNCTEGSCDLCDDSCRTIPCPVGQICTSTESNQAPHCENDPCGGSKCSGDTFCRGGGCVKSCGSCKFGTQCKDGECVPNLCNVEKPAACSATQVCDPTTGLCMDSPCAVCAFGSVCDLSIGKCVVDQCKIVTCPKGLVCVNNGNCAGKPGGGGCDMGRQVDANGYAAVALALLAMLMMLRRRAVA